MSDYKRQPALRAGANELTTREAVVELIRAWRAFQTQKKTSQPDLFAA